MDDSLHIAVDSLAQAGTRRDANILDPGALKAKVLAEQIRVLYGMPALIPINLLNAALTAFVLADFYPTALAFAWLGSFLVVLPARLLDWWRFQHDPSAKPPFVWGRRFAIGATVTGFLWGMAGSVIFLTPEPAYHAFISFVLGGMTAGAVIGDSAYLPALAGFVVSAILPALVGLFTRGDPMSIAMGLMLAAFVTALGIVGFRANNWIAAIARREIEEAALAADLEKEVAERRQTEKALLRSNGILEAVAMSATEILRSLDFDRSIPKVLELIGRSMAVSRVQLFENDSGASMASGKPRAWFAPGAEVQIEARALWQLAKAQAQASSAPLLAQGKVQIITAREAGEPLRHALYLHGVQSFLLVPVLLEGALWGAIGVGDRDDDRIWSTVEIDTLRTLAELIGSAIAHSRDLREVADAGRIIENSSTILYRLDPRSPHAMTYISRNIGQYGYTPAELLVERDRFMDLFHPDDLPDVLADLEELVNKRASEVTGEFRIRTATGSYRWVENRTRSVHSERRLVALEGVLIDINDRKLAELEMRRLRHTDLLTGLPNRAAFMERLHKAFTAAREGAKPFSLLLLDLDRFKDINETLGHSVGDELLVAVARRLGSGLRDGDPIARVGGDEFAVFLGGMADPAVIGALATRLMRSIMAPYVIGGSEIHVTGSVGISVYRAGLTKPEDMMREADLALYEAKDGGRNKYVFHSDTLDRRVREHVAMIEELRAALERCEFEVYYQPQVEVPSRKIIGIEALLRWNHPSRGLLTPGHFIAIAEKTGMIGPIGQWVLTEVLRQLREWRSADIAPAVVAVNLSAAQLVAPAEFQHDLMQSLGADGLDPGTIELELTESVLMETTRGHRDMINDLRALGVRVAIDDFGTGYSSLEYLLLYRVSRIKIAQQFVKGLPEDRRSAAIVRATIGLAREFGIEVIAEGVETAAQLEFLTSVGCPRIQGYYFSRPVPAGQAAALLQQGVIAPAAERS